MLKEFLYYAVLFIATFCPSAKAQPVPISPGDDAAVTTATQGLCHRQIVMLGESLTHKDGHTDAFKVALAERLVNQCGFDSIFFEASHYEFINLNRRLRMGQKVTAEDVSSAVGGLWKFDQGFQPLPSFLLARARAGKLFPGGIDDQLGEAGQDYANVGMVTELTNLLPQEERRACSVALHKLIYGEDTDTSPNSESDRAQMETWLSEMLWANAADKTTDRRGRGERQEMISAVQRWISRGSRPDAEYAVNRDRSMFQNFEWLVRQQPRPHKVIIWAATVHIAKQGDPTWGDHKGTNFGSLVDQKYGNRAFSLGFSALAGSYKEVGRHEIREIPAAPSNSIEAQACRANSSDAIFVGPARLAAMGTVPGAFFRHSYQSLSWSTFLDGVVVFRKEYPPRDIRGN